MSEPTRAAFSDLYCPTPAMDAIIVPWFLQRSTTSMPSHLANMQKYVQFYYQRVGEAAFSEGLNVYQKWLSERIISPSKAQNTPESSG